MTESNSLSIGDAVDDYVIHTVLRGGGFANAYVVSNKQGERFFMKELFSSSVVQRAENGFDVKVISGKHKYWKRACENFEKEASVLSALQHDRVPAFVDAFSENGTLYLIQGLVEGVNLSDWIASNELTNEFANELLVKLLEILAYVHQQGVLHRDIKPDNIVLVNESEPHLVDFGNVRLEIGNVTHNIGNRAATEGYSAFEVINTKAEQEAQNETTDLYSLAATFYRLLFREEPVDAHKRWDPLKPEKTRHKDDRSFMELEGRYDDALLNSLEKAFQPASFNRTKSATDWLGMLEPSVSTSENFLFFEVGREPSQDPSIPRLVIDNDAISGLHLTVAIEANATPKGGATVLLKDCSANGSSIAISGKWERFESRFIEIDSYANTVRIELRLAETTLRLSDLIDAYDNQFGSLGMAALKKTSDFEASSIRSEPVLPTGPQRSPLVHESPPEPALPSGSKRTSRVNGRDDSMLHLLFSFKGRIPRLQWWVGYALNILFCLGAGIFGIFGGIILNSLNAPPELIGGLGSLAGIVVAIGSLWSSLAVTVKRLRDRGFSNTAIFILIVAPFPLSVLILVLGGAYFFEGANSLPPDLVIASYLLLIGLSLYIFAQVAILGSKTEREI